MKCSFPFQLSVDSIQLIIMNQILMIGIDSIQLEINIHMVGGIGSFLDRSNR